MSDLSAFMTGSRVYGKPKFDSDYDLVVFVSEEDLAVLKEASDEPVDYVNDANYFRGGGVPLRFGKLNLLCVTDEDHYRMWEEGTETLKKGKNASREFAVSYFNELRKKAGLADY